MTQYILTYCVKIFVNIYIFVPQNRNSEIRKITISFFIRFSVFLASVLRSIHLYHNSFARNKEIHDVITDIFLSIHG